jgi:phenylacetate-CoA oxygenase PaaH subunit
MSPARGALQAATGYAWPMSAKVGRDRVWEVFRQETEGDPFVHAGNVRAPDEELATHYAREFFGRRQESHRLWIVDRAAIVELGDPDLLKPPFDRSFKRPGGYVIRHKLEAAKARATAGGQQREPAAEDAPR